MDLTSLLTREWRPGRRFGRRLRRLPPPRPSPVPLYSLGTTARMERLRSWYAKTGITPNGGADPAVQLSHSRE
jgi:hypothetical protein